MKFSIITPVLNGLPELRAAARSVALQSHKDWEHIVQDGGSTDGTVEWLRTQPDLLWRSEKDGGMYDAINRGMTQASGDILAWLNADEQYLPDTLATVQAWFDTHAEADAVFGDYIVARSDGTPLALRREIALRRWYAVNGTLNVQSCTLFFRRSAWERVGPFDVNYRIAGDKEWILRALDCGVRFAHLPACLAVFCLAGSNLSYHPQRAVESERIRARFGAFRNRALRLLPLALRRIEKALRGGYGKQDVRFDFIDPESLQRRTISAQLGGKWQEP